MTLYLLPNLLADDSNLALSIPSGLEEILYSLDGFFVETPKQIRKFLKHFDFDRLRDKPMEIVDRRSDDFTDHMNLLKKGGKWGLISDGGLPCIADPGARLVLLAKTAGIKIEAIPGPSSIFLALQLSGLYSQKFTFYGYMPKKGQTKQAYEPQSMPDVDFDKNSNNSNFDMDTSASFEADHTTLFDIEMAGGKDKATAEHEAEDDPFSDKNRWKRTKDMPDEDFDDAW